MSNVLPTEKRLQVLAALVDGNSVRAVERMTGAHQRTIRKFALAMGEGAQRLHDRLARDLTCPLIQVDEQWSFVQKKEARVTPADGREAGDAWTWVAVDANSRMVVAFAVGKRDQATAEAFMADLRSRLLVMPQITSDGLSLYEPVIGSSFGPGVDYAKTIKNYRGSATRGPDHRYEPPRGIDFITKTTVFGVPDLSKASTAYVERVNLTHRHMNGRTRRLCLAFSKRLEHHRAAAALTYVYANLCRVVKTLRVTPAMAAGVTDHVWGTDEFMASALAEVPSPKPVAKQLAHRAPEVPARELPNGRGFLRVVQGGKAVPVASSPPPEPPLPAPRTQEPTVPSVNEADMRHVTDDRQLDLFAWKPQEPKQPTKNGAQLTLFGSFDE